MRGKILLTVAMLATAFSTAMPETATASDPYAAFQVWSYNYQMDRPWHGGYYHQSYGQPLALVVPPTATHRQTLSWGVSQNLMYPLHHQFGRNASSPGCGGPRAAPSDPGNAKPYRSIRRLLRSWPWR